MATFFLRASGGSDANDGLSFANAFATAQKMADTMVAGDLGLVASDGVHNISTTVDLDTNAGTFALPIDWRGAGALGEDDGSVATFNGSGLGGGGVAIFTDGLDTTADYVQFEGIRFTAGNSFNFEINNFQKGMQFKRCRFDNAVNDGFRTSSPATYIHFIDCEIDNNGDEGIGEDSTGRLKLWMTNCLIHDNAGNGIEIGHVMTLNNCWIFKNGGNGVVYTSNLGQLSLVHCVIDANIGDGVVIGLTSTGSIIINNIISNNGGWGLTFDGDDVHGIRGSNLYHNNTLGNVTFDGISEDTFADFDTIAGSLTGDPLYNSVVDGSEDYRVGSDSPAFKAGYPQTLMESSTLGGFANFAHIGSNVLEAAAAGGGIIGG